MIKILKNINKKNFHRCVILDRIYCIWNTEYIILILYNIIWYFQNADYSFKCNVTIKIVLLIFLYIILLYYIYIIYIRKEKLNLELFFETIIRLWHEPPLLQNVEILACLLHLPYECHHTFPTVLLKGEAEKMTRTAGSRDHLSFEYRCHIPLERRKHNVNKLHSSVSLRSSHAIEHLPS